MTIPQQGPHEDPARPGPQTPAPHRRTRMGASRCPEAAEPDQPAPLEQVVASYLRRGRYGLAIRCAQRAAARDPEDPRLLRLLGYALEVGGEPDLARAAYLAAVAVGANPRHPQPWLRLARLERAQGRLDAAERYARRALGVAPHSAEVYAELARILLQDGRPDRALALVTSGLQHAPDDPALIDLRVAALPAATSGRAGTPGQGEAPPMETS